MSKGKLLHGCTDINNWGKSRKKNAYFSSKLWKIQTFNLNMSYKSKQNIKTIVEIVHDKHSIIKK